MQSKKPQPSRIRAWLITIVLSEVVRQGIKLIGTVAVPLILQHIGQPPGPELTFV